MSQSTAGRVARNILVLTCAATQALAAQANTEIPAATDRAFKAAWVSVGFGSGSSPVVGGSEAATAALTVTSQRYVGVLRAVAIGTNYRTGGIVRGEGAALFGIRSRGSRVFGLAAIGISKATMSQTCPRPPYAPKDPNCYAASLGTGTGLAFEASAMANAWVPGVELNISGALGGERTRYTAITFGLQFGWFGR